MQRKFGDGAPYWPVTFVAEALLLPGRVIFPLLWVGGFVVLVWLAWGRA